MLKLLSRKLGSIEQNNPPAAAIYGAAERRAGPTALVARGQTFNCPVCGAGYRRFLPFGLARRRHAMCPGCGSLERHRFMWLYLRDVVGALDRRMRVLHAAPEACIGRALGANRALRYVTVDMFDPAAQHRADLTALPFPAGAFDLVICSHVLEHVEDDVRAMREIRRVLGPGGRAVIMVPIDMKRAKTYEDSSITTAAGRNTAFGHPYHVRICGADYPDRLTGTGFRVSTVFSTEMSRHRRRFWRISKTVLFDCLRHGSQ